MCPTPDSNRYGFPPPPQGGASANFASWAFCGANVQKSNFYFILDLQLFKNLFFMKDSITVFAPATMGNVGVGFDVMGLCIDNPGDEVIITKNNTGKIVIKKITGDDGKLSLSPSKNTVSVAITALLKHLKLKQGFDIILNKKMPLGSGLGSSAASAVAGIFAANILLGKPIKSRKNLIPFAMEGERVACGTAHADNVAPCMLGGIVLIRKNNPLEIIELAVPKKLIVVMVHPHIELLTKDSRAVMPKEITVKTASKQWANTAALVAGLYKNDFKIIGNSIEDFVAEPYRSKLIPQFDIVKSIALKSGAIACSISGSGPSVFAFCTSKKRAKFIGNNMKLAFAKGSINSTVYVSNVNTKGVRVL